MKKRLIVGISGASGAPLAAALLRQLRRISDVETHLICSEHGGATVTYETDLSLEALHGLADVVYKNTDRGAAPASGSFKTIGMVIIPCSMKTLAGITSGYCENLLLRAADVTIKEQRRLVLVPRECPFSTLHLRNLTTASELGAVIIPPVPAYYNHPRTVDEVNLHVIGKVLDHLGLENDLVKGWGGI